MPSLAEHVGDPANHDRLPFHPSCPICRQTRLTGRLPADELVPPRTQALVAASVLAVSSIAPVATAIAAEQDQQQNGTAAVTPTTSDPADNPDFDPGGDATDLPKTAPPVPQAQAPADPGNDDTAAVDQTPATNPDDPVIDSGDGSDPSTTAPSTSTQPTPAPTDTSAASPQPPASPPADASAPTGPAPTTVPPAVSPADTAAAKAVRRASGASRGERRSHARAKSSGPRTSHVTSAPAVTAPAPAVTAPVQAAAAPITVSGHHAEPGDHTHTVLAGESLWAIATDVLGGDATTASVAREVHRLWQLNKDRIGTGDPDLLMVGTRLELR